MLFAGSWTTLLVRQRDKTRTVLPKPNIITRLFYASTLDSNRYDFGGPYDYSECRDIVRNPLYDIYKVNSTIYRSVKLT